MKGGNVMKSKQVYAVVKNEKQNFGKELLVKNIVAVKDTLIQAQTEHKILCFAANDLQGYAIRGPYNSNDNTIKEFIKSIS